MISNATQYRARGGLWWSGFSDIPVRVSAPLAEMEVSRDRIVFHALFSKKWELAREEVVRIREEPGFMVCRLNFEHNNERAPRLIKFAITSKDKFEALKAEMTALGWEVP